MELFEQANRTSVPVKLSIKGKYKEDNIVSKTMTVLLAERTIHQVNKELFMLGCPHTDV